MTRSSAILGTLLLVLALAGPVSALEATPEASASILAGLGYPELGIVAHDDRFEVPTQINAGRTLVVYENVGGESRHSMILRLPDGLDIDRAMEGLYADAIPEWMSDLTFPGNVGETLPGETRYAVVDLEPGTYLVVDDFAASFEVAGADATPAAAPTPESDTSIALIEFGFEVPEGIAAGRQVWEVTNTGELPHELLLIWSPEPVTREQIFEMMTNGSGDEGATPVGGGPSFAEMVPAGGISWLSPGTTGWTEVDLRPGTYIAMCFAWDEKSGTLHVEQGMLEVFTVGDGGTPAA